MADEFVTKEEFELYKNDITNQIKNLHMSSDLKMQRIDESLRRIEEKLDAEIENMKVLLTSKTSGNSKVIWYFGAAIGGLGSFLYGLYSYLDGRINELVGLELSTRIDVIEANMLEVLCKTHSIHC